MVKCWYEDQQGRPFVAVISAEDYERFMKDWEADFAVLDELSARNLEVTAEEAEADAAREIAAYRKERKAKAKGAA